MSIPLEHKRLLCGCKSRKELMVRLQTFVGNNAPPYNVYNKAINIWNNREEYLKEVESVDQKKAEELHKVMVPMSIKTKPHACKNNGDSLPDVGESLVKIHHLLAEQIQIQKESLELFKKLSEKKT